MKRKKGERKPYNTPLDRGPGHHVKHPGGWMPQVRLRPVERHLPTLEYYDETEH